MAAGTGLLGFRCHHLILRSVCLYHNNMLRNYSLRFGAIIESHSTYLGNGYVCVRREFCHTPDPTGDPDPTGEQTTRKSRVHRMRQQLRQKHRLQNSDFSMKDTSQSEDAGQNLQDDFYGIADNLEEAQREPSNTMNASPIQSADISRKYFGYLRRPKDVSEKIIDVTYGYMRLDCHNNPQDTDDNKTSYLENVGEYTQSSSVERISSNDTQSSSVERISSDNNIKHVEDITTDSNISLGRDQEYHMPKHNEVKNASEDIDQKDIAVNYIEEKIISDSQFASATEHDTLLQSNTFLQDKCASTKLKTQQNKDARNVQDRRKSKDLNLFEEYYFPPKEQTVECQPILIDIVTSTKNSATKEKSDIIQEQDFSAPGDVLIEKRDESSSPNVEKEPGIESNHRWTENRADVKYEWTSSENLSVGEKSRSGSRINLNLSHEASVIDESYGKPIDEIYDKVTKQEERIRSKPVPNIENPQTAYDMAMKIRLEQKQVNSEKNENVSVAMKHKWSGKLDTKGFRILKDQVLYLDNYPEDVVVKILRDSIIFDHEDVLALDKPYGMACHGGPGIHHSVGQLLPKLAQKLDRKLERLYLVHRLDKETTGVMLLAKTEEMAWKLHRMFRKREVVKKYWVLTKGVPSPIEGVIDIPMAEGTVEGKYRMALRPNYSPEAKLLAQANTDPNKLEAITTYKVLDSHGSCALVECQPETGLKHQIRCHLAFGLNTPILGDHKYSHMSRLVPQRLYSDMLQHLKIRQATVRYVPMHLHAKQVILPELYQGRNLFISARLPRHFVQNMKWLKIKPPK